ncbi:MAG: DUF5996 family protein [Thermoanaerobaculia bacterium]
MKQPSVSRDVWPQLPNTEWTETLATLHLWTQIVGKVRLELSPWINHSWQATLYVTSRGLTTSPIPNGGNTFQIDFDFVDHNLLITTSDGSTVPLPLRPQTVADFYRDLMAALDSLGIDVSIHTMPNELEDPIPFPEDVVHSSYEPEQVHLFWRALVQSARVFEAFRARFIGKCSPVHLFWGSFDQAVTRFSGRPAPKHPGGIPSLPDVVTVESYSKEVSSCGFWPGNAGAPDPIFYSYAYPTPEGFAEHPVKPDAAFWLADLGEFVLPYEAVRTSDDPDATLTAFLESTYEATADLADWDRADFERPAGYTPYQSEG